MGDLLKGCLETGGDITQHRIGPEELFGKPGEIAHLGFGHIIPVNLLQGGEGAFDGLYPLFDLP